MEIKKEVQVQAPYVLNLQKNIYMYNKKCKVLWYYVQSDDRIMGRAFGIKFGCPSYVVSKKINTSALGI
jgi:hypothetical protein